MKKIILALVLLSLSLPALAQPEHEEGPCKKDRETLCGGKKPGREMFKCMRENKDKMSAECKSHMEAKKEKWKDRKEMKEAMMDACEKDPTCKAKRDEMMKHKKEK